MFEQNYPDPSALASQSSPKESSFNPQSWEALATLNYFGETVIQ